MNMPREELDRLDLLVQERTGLAPSRVHAATREHVVRRAMARTGSQDVASFRALVEREPLLFEELIADLTVPESYFFRDAPQFERLRQQIVPALLAARPSHHRLNVWSAGCAGGEEPYSLAIMLERMGLAQRSRVLGSDISRTALRRAEHARYSRWSLRALSSADVASYFVEQQGHFRLLPRISERVRFALHNLSTDGLPRGADLAGFDLILCRNVLIYFSPEAAAAAIRRLSEALAEGGVLLMGASDPVVSLAPHCRHEVTAEGTLYFRTGARSLPALARALSHVATPSATSSSEKAKPPPRSRPPLRPAETPHAEPSPRGAVESDEAEREGLRELHRIARERGSEAAEVACRLELARRPLAASVHALHATLLSELGRHDEASHALRRALYLDRKLPSAQLLDGMLAERRREIAHARRAYLQLAALCGGQPETWVDPVSGLSAGELAAIANARLSALRANQQR